MSEPTPTGGKSRRRSKRKHPVNPEIKAPSHAATLGSPSGSPTSAACG